MARPRFPGRAKVGFHINTLYSYIYIKSDTLGTLNWGHLSPASDNPAVLADISGSVIESNFVWFEGGGETSEGVSERVFVRTPDGWRIAALMVGNICLRPLRIVRLA